MTAEILAVIAGWLALWGWLSFWMSQDQAQELRVERDLALGMIRADEREGDAA